MISHVHLVVIKEKIVYPTDVPHLHEFCTFSVPYLKIVVPHLKLEQLATLLVVQILNLKIVKILIYLIQRNQKITTHYGIKHIAYVDSYMLD